MRFSILLLLVAGCASPATTAAPTSRDASPAPAAQSPVAPSRVAPDRLAPDRTAPYLLHLPGIAGARRVDRRMVGGLFRGGYDGNVDIYDWTQNDPGLPALTNRQRNDAEAQIIADRLTALRRNNPRRTIVVTSHSGGTGVIVWALEKLPPDVKVDRVFLLASALSPNYDLTQALSHVEDRMWSFWSPYDTTVLSIGTSLFGTIDGPKVPAAGCVGFIKPPAGDAAQYQKLKQVPYDPAWLQWNNPGLHIGPLHPNFSRRVLTPLVNGATDLPTTQPSPRPFAGWPRS